MGWEMMEDLATAMGDDLILEELARYLPEDVLEDAMRHIARKHNYELLVDADE